VGSPFINDLCAVLLLFWSYFFALSTDIEKAFLHVKLHQADRDFICFLWPCEPECVDSDLQIYRFASAPFGTASSSFMLHAIPLTYIYKSLNLQLQKTLAKTFMDNIISGFATEDHATH